MNIFVLDTDPKVAAEMLCDKHVIKMLLETAQLLCSVFWFALKSNDLIQQNISIPYKMTHYNHPCSIWARASQRNFNWLLEHGIALCQEYFYRYNKVHKSERVIYWCNENKKILYFTLNDLTSFVQAMPEQYRSENPVESYRTYYMQEKYYFAKWEKGREKPHWFNR